MATTTLTTESEILDGLVFPFDQDLDPQAARSLLRIRFDRQATKQINQLLRKNQRGSNRSHRGQQRWHVLLVVVGFNGGDEPRVYVARLAAAGFDHAQKTLHELTPRFRLGAERQLPPDDGMTQRLFGGVVGRLHTFDVNERPQVLAVLHQLLAKAIGERVAITAQQKGVHALADWLPPVSYTWNQSL
jgi:hypothetical protein